MVRKKVVQQAGGWNGKRGQDFDLINKVSKISRGAFVKRFLGEHRRLKLTVLDYIKNQLSFYGTKLKQVLRF